MWLSWTTETEGKSGSQKWNSGSLKSHLYEAPQLHESPKLRNYSSKIFIRPITQLTLEENATASWLSRRCDAWDCFHTGFTNQARGTSEEK